MTASRPDLTQVHERLRAILAPYRDRLHVARDGPGGITLDLEGQEGKPWGYAAGTRLAKRYVSYYLMGVYGDDGLAASIAPDLRRRMQATRASTSCASTRTSSPSSRGSRLGASSASRRSWKRA